MSPSSQADDQMYAPALDAAAEAVATIPVVFAVNVISSLSTYDWVGLRDGIGSEPFRRFFFINVLCESSPALHSMLELWTHPSPLPTLSAPQQTPTST